jgi:hypothetical protein
MPFRQLTLFRIGCWVAVVAAVAHLVGPLADGPASAGDDQRRLVDLAEATPFAMPLGGERTFVDLFEGAGLAVALLLAVLGIVGLVVEKRGRHDGALMIAVARAMALGSAALLVISLVYWFLIPSLLIATMTCAFAFASVRPPATETG